MSCITCLLYFRPSQTQTGCLAIEDGLMLGIKRVCIFYVVQTKVLFGSEVFTQLICTFSLPYAKKQVFT